MALDPDPRKLQTIKTLPIPIDPVPKPDDRSEVPCPWNPRHRRDSRSPPLLTQQTHDQNLGPVTRRHPCLP